MTMYQGTTQNDILHLLSQAKMLAHQPQGQIYFNQAYKIDE